MIEPQERDFKRHTRRSFVVAGLAAVAGGAAFQWLRTRREDNGVPWPLRRMLEVNEQVARDLFRESRTSPEFAASLAAEPKPNGDIGLQSDLNPQDWRLHLFGGRDDGASEAGFSLDVIKALPKIDMVTELKCIEGWSQVVHWAGARFSDFRAQYGPTSMTQYVSMETPDHDYCMSASTQIARSIRRRSCATK